MIDPSGSSIPFARFASGVVRNAGPGWFTSVMGTGILAIALTVAPVQLPVFSQLGAALFAIAVAMFVVFAIMWGIGIARRPRSVIESLHDTARAQTWAHHRWHASPSPSAFFGSPIVRSTRLCAS